VDPHDPSKGTDPTKEDLLTIDAAPPAATVQALPASESSATFNVNWSGADDANGSGINHYDIYVSDNGGAFVPFLLGATNTTAPFTGQVGHSYGFYAVATDNAGNVQPTPTAPQATTFVGQGVAPAVNAAAYVYTQLPHTLTFTFNKDVSASLSVAAVQVQNLTTGTSVTPVSVSYNAATNTATFSFAGKLPDGNYRVTLLASVVADAGGIHLPADYTLNFYYLTGDVNHDHSVNFSDLLLLAQNYGRANATFAQGDLTYDGSVNFTDLLLLAQNYGRTLAAATAQTPAATLLGAMDILGGQQDAAQLPLKRRPKPARR